MDLELEQTRLNGYEAVVDTGLFPEETLEMIVPDACPDILRILDTEGWVELSGREAQEGRLELSGTVRASVLYLPDGEEGVRRLEVSIPFTCGMENPKLNSRCVLTALPRVEAAETRALNPRKVLVRASLALEVQAWLPREEVVCSGVSEGDGTVEQLCEPCRTYGAVWVGEKPFSFADEVAIPGSRPAAAELLKYRLSFSCNESKVIGSKLIFKGEADLRLLYRSMEGDLCQAEFQLPFSQIMEAAEAAEECDCTLEIIPTSLQCTLEAGEGRMVQVSMELLAQAVLREERSFSLLTDLYSTAWTLEAQPAQCRLEHRVDLGSRSQMVREVLECGALADLVADAYASVGRVSQSREGGRLNLEAEVVVTVLFQEEGGGLTSATRRFPVPCALEAPEDAVCRCRCLCPEEVFATPTAGGVEVRFPVEFRYLLCSREERPGVSAARLDTDTPRSQEDQPSIVLRMVGRGERLWDIAKHYGTTAAEIRRANRLEEGELPPGELLLIPKKRA